MSTSDAEGSSSRFNYRPTSTIARSFSDQLNDAFLIDDNLDKLTSTVEQKKQSVTFQSHELKFLEESIQRAEALLEERKNRFSQQFPGSSSSSSAADSNSNGNGNTPSSSSSRKTRPPIPSYDENEKATEPNGAEPKRTAPKPPGTEGYVVVQKTPSILAAAAAGSEEKRRFDEKYQGRPPPPVPAES